MVTKTITKRKATVKRSTASKVRNRTTQGDWGWPFRKKVCFWCFKPIKGKSVNCDGKPAHSSCAKKFWRSVSNLRKRHPGK